MSQTWIAAVVFFITYILIVTERVHRTVSAMLGGMAMILLRVVTQAEAFRCIDWNVIFLLVGMMVIANVLRETGLFQWLAVQAVRLGKGRPVRIMLVLCLVTALSSALLDNVTIVVLVVPVTLFVTGQLGLNPLPFLIAEILACNIGGTATLIGDPPNILIGSAAGIDFTTFIVHMGPISLLILLAFLGLAWLIFRKELRARPVRAADLSALEARDLLTNRPLLRKGVIVMGGVIVGFLAHGTLHIEPATIALAGATLLLLWSRADPHHAIREVEWTTLFFFVGLFIVVEGLVRTGIIQAVAQAALRVVDGNLPLASMVLLWLSALVSGIVDNIPYTVTMIPLVENLGQAMPVMPLWWSLALGACLGGNTTLVGASANVVVASLAERSGHPIGFWRFLGYGVLTTVLSLLLATAYVWLRYL
ncbi:MAG: ArsB/NhaD family transporter [Anaerolineae bacterium]|nr:ArsB/NhaD family transporter [Anaerolineae bacterium]